MDNDKKRPASLLTNLLDTQSKEQKRTVAHRTVDVATRSHCPANDPCLQHPVDPQKKFNTFLTQVANTARRKHHQFLASPQADNEPLCEIEARLGILEKPFCSPPRRVLSSGPKKSIQGRLFSAFNCTDVYPKPPFESGISHSHYKHWTDLKQAACPIFSALRVKGEKLTPDNWDRVIDKKESIEVVYDGYLQKQRLVFGQGASSGRMEQKLRLDQLELALPAAPYDVRIALSTETTTGSHPSSKPPPSGWTTKRVKKRQSFQRTDCGSSWRIDVTQVTTSYNSKSSSSSSSSSSKKPVFTYEMELELQAPTMLKLITEKEEGARQKLITKLAQELWWMLYNLNPLSEVLSVDDYLRPHPDKPQVKLALATCAALKKFLKGSTDGTRSYESPILSTSNIKPPSSSSSSLHKLPGCMPVSFRRRDLQRVLQQDNYMLSEKTDGVRHFLVFTGKTAVLIDRDLQAKQPIPRLIIRSSKAAAKNAKDEPQQDPFEYLLGSIQPGTVMDGEVVIHRKLRRPIFIVFDLLAYGSMPILHLQFDERRRHIWQASFRTNESNQNIFDDKYVLDTETFALPLVRKNFVPLRQLPSLLDKVKEERGMRTYYDGKVHCHLTDGIIFHPNTQYICGTDNDLLKWKYLDTVTIDVELLPGTSDSDNGNGDDLRVAVLGERIVVSGAKTTDGGVHEQNSRIEMTRHVYLPKSEKLRLEADRSAMVPLTTSNHHQSNNNNPIAEIGFDPVVGEWYYHTMRTDKSGTPNHISTVMGVLLELSESVNTKELCDSLRC